MTQSEPVRWKRSFAEPSRKKFLLDFMHEKIQGLGLLSHIIRGTRTTVEEGNTERDRKSIPNDVTLAPKQAMPQARTILGLFYYMSDWSIFLLIPVWVGFYVFIHTCLKDLEMFILKRKTPRRNMNAFQIFERCWVEELLEYSVCLQRVELGSVGICFSWSDFRSI